MSATYDGLGIYNSFPINASYLAEDTYLVFFNDLEPMMVDPEEIVKVVPDTSIAEAAEYINFYSRQAEEILDGLKAAIQDPNISTTSSTLDPTLIWTATAYVKAATLCDLGKIYSLSDAEDVNMMLGDLTIGARHNLTPDPTRANATTWCALTEVLRQEMLRNRASMRAVVKGSNGAIRPLPSRRRWRRIR